MSDKTPEWQYVTSWTERLQVPGGWLYKYREDGAMVFVPTPPLPSGCAGAATYRGAY